ncbi:hypothetical protein Lesp02_02670 [Lentzea sp. NBRC 105346]|uniref:restriction endonuclease-related protein n=1 Tax=Lentzea sp. NBRC 105346 TaxID=3032205 RepID=UPI0024A5BBAC|nr:hypothetical protein [Lentzea sp. NBRC 105346]GLZ28077.1 hypothetical protein Lesp02_02670 [Lentzea sp. NBRC 105346]
MIHSNVSPDADDLSGAGSLQETFPSSEITNTTSDYLIVTLLATGLAAIKANQVQRDADRGVISTRRLSRSDLLPAPWRAGFARLWWRFQQAGLTAPEDDLTLFELCRTPFVEWDVQLELSATDREASLLDGDELSELAREAAKLGVRDVEADFVEEQSFAVLKAVAAMNATTDDQVQANYELLRRFLIDHTVISDKQVRELMRRFPAPGANGQPYVQSLIDTAYERHHSPTPTVTVRCCDGCGNPLPVDGARCGTAGCAGAPATRELRVFDAYFAQHRGVRRYIHDAGLLEVRLHDTLRAALPEHVVFLQPWPGRDAFDLLVAFLDPADPDPRRPVEVWGADGKDHASPSLLAIGFRWKHHPRCDRRFLVLPMHRARQLGYVRDLETELEGRDRGVKVINEEEFVRLVIARAQQIGGGA